MEMKIGFKKIATMTAASLVGLMGATQAFASTVNVNLSEEHQVIRGFGGMVHQSWQGNGGLNESDAQLPLFTMLTTKPLQKKITLSQQLHVQQTA